MKELEIFRSMLYGMALSLLVAVALLLNATLPLLEGFSFGMFMGNVLLIPISIAFVFPFTYFLLVNRQADWMEFKALLGGVEPQPHVEYQTPPVSTSPFKSSAGFEFGGYRVQETEEETL